MYVAAAGRPAVNVSPAKERVRAGVPVSVSEKGARRSRRRVPFVEVPGYVQAPGGPGAGAGQVVEREARCGAVVRDLDVVVALPGGPPLHLDDPAGRGFARLSCGRLLGSDRRGDERGEDGREGPGR